MMSQVDQLNQQMRSDTQRQSELQARLTAEEERLAQIKANATVSDQEIVDLLERRKQFQTELKDLEKAGVSMVGGGSPRAASYFMPTASIPNAPIPALATGAVIPPNREFLAVLGDQRHGTNMEAPFSMIEEASERAVEKVLRRNNHNNGGSPSNSHVIHNVVQINRRMLVDELIDELKLRQTVSGRNPLELT